MKATTATVEAMLDVLFANDLIVSLHTDDPGTNGANESTDTLRVTIESDEWNAYETSGNVRRKTNAEEEEFTASATTTEEVTHFGVWAADGTTFMWSDALTNPQTLVSGNPVRFPAGSFFAGMVIDDTA